MPFPGFDRFLNLKSVRFQQVTFKHEGKDIEIGEKYTFNYSRNGIVKLQVSIL
jgi:hypothetical protein